MDYLVWYAGGAGDPALGRRSARANAIASAMKRSHAYEQMLGQHLIEGVLAIPGVRFFGIRDTARMSQRVPTIAIRVGDQQPRETAAKLGEQGICVWDGNYYALNLTERLGVEDQGGMVRIGLTHYNTIEEIDRCLNALEGCVRGR
jgi:selenocysteine lyase/cysteine desulfurase